MTLKSVRTFIFVLAIAMGVASAVGTARADVPPTPGATACPAAFERLSVASLEALGPYFLPRRVDAAGNNNGYVCGLARPESVQDAFCNQGAINACTLGELGLSIYLFRDDDNPASQ
jgi:hypothetical protein